MKREQKIIKTLKDSKIFEINQPSTNLLPTLSKEQIQEACDIHYRDYPAEGDELKYIKVAYIEGAKWATTQPIADNATTEPVSNPNKLEDANTGHFCKCKAISKNACICDEPVTNTNKLDAEEKERKNCDTCKYDFRAFSTICSKCTSSSNMWQQQEEKVTHADKNRIIKKLVGVIRNHIKDEGLIMEIETDLVWLAEWESIHNPKPELPYHYARRRKNLCHGMTFTTKQQGKV